MITEGSNPSPSTNGGKEQSNGLANRLIARPPRVGANECVHRSEGGSQVALVR